MSPFAAQSSALTSDPPDRDVPDSLFCRFIDTGEAFQSMASEWDRLWRLNPNGHIFQSFGFISSWLIAYRASWRPYMPVVTCRNRVIGIIPLVVRNRELRFAGHIGSDYNEILCAPDDRAIVFRVALETLFADFKRWNRMILGNIPGEAAIESCIDLCPQYIRRRVLIVAKTECPTLLFGERNENLQETVRKDKLRKAARVFERLGTVTYRHLDSPEEIRAHLPHFIEQHVRRHRLAGRTSVLSQPEVVEFIQTLADRLDARHEFRFSVLEVNGRPTAYHLGYVSAGRYIFHKPAFDVDLWDYSPGQVLLFHLWNSLLEGGTTEFDFSVGPEAYKYRFANHIRHNIDAAIYAPGIGGSIRCGLRKIWHWANGALRQDERIVERVKQWVSNLETIQAQIRSRGLGRFCLNCFRKYVYRCEHSSVYLGQFAGQYRSPGDLIRAKLSMLIDLYGEGPGIDDARLQQARERMKCKENSAYLRTLPGHPSEVVWTRKTDRITLESRSVALTSSALVVYDHWNTASLSYRPPSPELLGCVSAEASRLNLPLCIVAPARRARKPLRKAGFIPLATVTTHYLFGNLLPRARNQSRILNVDAN